MVFDAEGREAARHQLEHRQILPGPGLVEHDPLEIVSRMNDVMAGALGAAGLTGRDLAAIGVTNQRETTVVWDPTNGRPWHNALVWQDTRTDRAVRALEPEHAMLCERTGLPPSPYFSATKLRWILDHVEGVREAAHRGRALFGTIDTWLVWNLTGGPDGGLHVTDVTNASRTQLMNLRTLDWDEGLLGLFGVPRQMLPAIVASSAPAAFGTTRASGPLGAEVPIGASLGDQHAATMGQACFAPGDAKNTYGTGNFLVLNTGSRIVPSTSGLLTTLAYRLHDAEPVYALEGSIAVTGAAVQWLRDQLGIIQTAAEVEALAASVPDSGGMYFVPRVLRPVRPLLAIRRPWRHRRPVAFSHQGAPGARDTRGHVLPDAGRRGCDGPRLRRAPRGPEGGRRRHVERFADAASGRRSRVTRRAAGGG